MSDAPHPEETSANRGDAHPQAASSAEVPETLIHQPEGERELQQEATVKRDGESSLPEGARASARGLTDTFGRYRVRGKLGQGGMGAVYVAHDTQLDRQVALKVPFFGENDGPAVIERFYREARAMATLHHPNICPVFDVGETDGVHFLTMALIDGRPLSDALKERTPCPQREAAAIVGKLARALQSAHESGVVHRDLKPSNIMIRADGEPVVMDFGLARRQEETATLTHIGTVMGTPAYMSPEQVEGVPGRVGPATDVYALGVILYQMLTGRLPFTGSLGTILSKILTEDPASLREFCTVDPELEAICLKAMARRIEDRYRTSGELAADLQRFLDGGKSAAQAEAEPRIGSTTPRTRRLLGIGIGAGLLMIAAVIPFTLHRGHEGTDETSERSEPLGGVPGAVPPALSDERWRLPPEPRRYPSFPEAVSHAPVWLVADENAPFDVGEYFETPVWEDNAAPLYLSALAEFSSEPLSCFTASEYEQRSPVLRDRSRRFLELYDRWENDPLSVPNMEIDRILQEHETGFQLLARAQRKHECVFETGVDVTTLIPHVQAARAVARVQRVRAWRELQDNDIDAVLEQLRVVLRLRRDIGHRSSEITTLVAVAIDSMACDGIVHDLLLHPSLNESHCDLALELLSEQEQKYDDGLRRGWQGAFTTTRVMLHDLRFRSGPLSPEKLAESISNFQFNKEIATPDGFLVAIWQTGKRDLGFDPIGVAQQLDSMSDMDFDQEVSIANAGYRSILDLIDRPIFERYKRASLLWDKLARNPDSRFIRYQMPSILPVFDAHRRGMTTLIGTKCLVCLRRWQLTHSDAPPDLESVLRDAGVSGLAIDPFGDGEPLRLTTIDGKPVIYSIGADGIDDQGLMEWNLSPGAPGDITFRLETGHEFGRRRTGQ